MPKSGPPSPPGPSGPPRGPRVTLADVGRRCGYHGTTVGLALRNSPAIPQATREKIQAAAAELGYQPDPVLASLIAYRSRRKSSRHRATIALVSDRATPSGWRESHHTGAEFHRGVLRRAAELGFSVEEHTVGPEREHTARLERIFRARGIRCLLMLPMGNIAAPVDFHWDSYCAIASGYSMPSPELPRITHHHRIAAETAFGELVRRGYRRIGLALAELIDARVNYGWSAGFFGAALRHRGSIQTCHYLPGVIYDLRGEPFLQWIRKERPDALVTTEIELADYLRELGYRVPGDIGIAFLDREDDDNRFSGIFQCFEEIGIRAVDLLSSLFINNNYGLPASPYSILVAGQWREGATLPPPPAS